jgi:hypothetical protein
MDGVKMGKNSENTKKQYTKPGLVAIDLVGDGVLATCKGVNGNSPATRKCAATDAGCSKS